MTVIGQRVPDGGALPNLQGQFPQFIPHPVLHQQVGPEQPNLRRITELPELPLQELPRFLAHAQKNVGFGQPSGFHDRRRRARKRPGQFCGLAFAAQRRQQLPVNHVLDQHVRLPLPESLQRSAIAVGVTQVRAHQQAQAVRQDSLIGVFQRRFQLLPSGSGLE